MLCGSKHPCEFCKHSQECRVVRCSKCQQVSYLEDWEVYDDFAVCPLKDCIVTSYDPVSQFVCCAEAQRIIDEEDRKASRKRKPKAPKALVRGIEQAKQGKFSESPPDVDADAADEPIAHPREFYDRTANGLRLKKASPNP